MPAIQKLPTFDTLSSYYAQVHNLAAYIRQCTKDRRGDDDFLLQAPDSVPYRELLSSSLVCLPKVTEPPQFQFFEHYDRMKDVIQRAQEHLLVSPKSRPNNIVTLGYKRVRSLSPSIPCTPDHRRLCWMEKRIPGVSSTVSSIQSSWPWRLPSGKSCWKGLDRMLCCIS
ncbi:hypothetical protein BDR03DRAFT_945242 [Suillus americanus]|nr:hypothetical protein BDR03DRAFT_945242 [Suillus americanus]